MRVRAQYKLPAQQSQLHLCDPLPAQRNNLTRKVKTSFVLFNMTIAIVIMISISTVVEFKNYTLYAHIIKKACL